MVTKKVVEYQCDFYCKEPKLKRVANKLIQKDLKGFSMYEISEILNFIRQEAPRFSILNASLNPV